MKNQIKRIVLFSLGMVLWIGIVAVANAEKPAPEAILQSLKDGNANFASGKLTHPIETRIIG